MGNRHQEGPCPRRLRRRLTSVVVGDLDQRAPQTGCKHEHRVAVNVLAPKYPDLVGWTLIAQVKAGVFLPLTVDKAEARVAKAC